MDNKILRKRYELVKSMHTVIRATIDENLYVSWTYIVPDGATDEDFWEIAEDNISYDDVCAKFTRLLRKGGADAGYYVSYDDNAHGMYETVEIDGKKQKVRVIPEGCAYCPRSEWEFIKDIDDHSALYESDMDGVFVARKL